MIFATFCEWTPRSLRRSLNATLEETIARYGGAQIFHTDQGSQFTSFAVINTLREADSCISKDGCGRRWMDNVFIERL